MNTKMDSGGYVFPLAVPDSDAPGGYRVDSGITRRDWLAGMAMQGIATASAQGGDSMHPTTALEVARSAYHVADIMIRIGNDDPSTYHNPAEVKDNMEHKAPVEDNE